MDADILENSEVVVEYLLFGKLKGDSLQAGKHDFRLEVLEDLGVDAL